MESTVFQRALGVAAIAGVLFSTGLAEGSEDGFRVESKVFVGSEKEPRAENTTIFCDGVIYDFSHDPPETIVLDPARGRFILLDPKRRLRTEVSTQEVTDLTESLKQWAAGQTDASLRFLAAPHFEERFDEQSRELVLESPLVTYRAATMEPASEAMVPQYRDFCDWYARLNARLTPGYKLVFARLALDEALQKRRQLPREITLTLQSKTMFGYAKTAVIRSEHQFIYHLVESDRDRISQINQYMAIFRAVDFSQYEKKAEQ